MSSNAAGFLAPGRSRFDRVEAQSLPEAVQSTKEGPSTSILSPTPTPMARQAAGGASAKIGAAVISEALKLKP